MPWTEGTTALAPTGFKSVVTRDLEEKDEPSQDSGSQLERR